MLTGILLLSLATVVSAAAMWGQYKGYDIIRITVDGKTVKPTDAPAIKFNGRTMVPIYMLQQAGVKYKWDDETKTVAVQSNATGSSDDDIKNLKELSHAMDFYKLLEDLGETISSMTESYSIAFSGLYHANDRSALDNAYDYLGNTIDIYNGRLEDYKELDALLRKSNYININSANDVLNKYYDAIDSLKLSLEGLESFAGNKSDANFNKYLDNSKDAFNLSMQGRELSHKNYESYVTKITNY